MNNQSIDSFKQPTFLVFLKLEEYENTFENLNKQILQNLVINCRFTKKKMSILHKCCQENYIKLLEYFITNYKDCNINITNSNKNTPLHTAVSAGFIESTKLLLANKANVNSQNNQNRTPLHLAILYEYIDIIKELINYNCDLLLLDNNQNNCIELILENMPDLLINVFDQQIHLLKRVCLKPGSIFKEQPITIVKNKDVKGILYLYDYKYINDLLFEKIIAKDNINIISHKLFTSLINYKWKAFARKQFFIYMVCYLLYLVLFIISTILFVEYQTQNKSINITTIALDSIIISMNTFYFVKEMIEIKKMGCIRYVNNSWNMLDLIQCILVYIDIPFRILNSSFQKIILSVVAPVFWIKLLYFCRGFRSMGPFVRMLFAMSIDIFKFCGFFTIFLFGFAHSFYILLGKTVDRYKTISETIVTLFTMNLGDFDITIYQESKYPITSQCLFIVFNIISVIVLLNLLIAIMGDSYSYINENSIKEWRLELSKLIVYIQNINYENYTKNYKINELYVVEKDRLVNGLKSIHSYNSLTQQNIQKILSFKKKFNNRQVIPIN